MDQIHTKWHKMWPLIDARQVYTTAGPKGIPYSESVEKFGFDFNKFEGLLLTSESLPRFAVDSELIRIAAKTEFQQSLLDLKKMGMLRFPFPQLVVEFTTKYPNSNKTSHAIILLREPIGEERESGFDFAGYRMSIDSDKDGQYLVVGTSYVGIGFHEGAEDGCMLKMHAVETELFKSLPGSLIEQTFPKDATYLFYAASAIMLLMGTAGVEKKVIETDRINRSRAKSGKPTIPKHTYLYIARIYKSEKSDASD